MIRSLDHLIGYRIAATNGDIGTVEDLFFHDNGWKLRYVVVAAGGWLNRRHVLLSWDVAGAIDDARRQMSVSLTKEAVHGSPDVDSDKPVTRQKEILLARHFGWKPYWTPDPFLGVTIPAERPEIDEELPGADHHLRSFRELTTYEAVSPDGGLHYFVIDLIADDRTRLVPSLVVADGRGRQNQAFLLPTRDVTGIDWSHRRVTVNARAVRHLAPFDPATPVNARRTVEYYDYLGHFHHSVVLREDRN